MSQVFFHTMRANIKKNLIDKVGSLLGKIELGDGLEPGRLVAVKVHFGEKGNTAYIRPVFVREVVDHLKAKGCKVFLTDTCTLYRGSREDAASHLETATTNGFPYSVVNAPLIIADGLKANDEVLVPIKGKHYEEVSIGSAVIKADAMVVLSHFKGHEVTGFGGAIKNLGMGCGTRKAKLSMHSTVAPEIVQSKCKGDRLCEFACTFDAITMVDKIARIDTDTCTGCGECLGVCPHQAISIDWDAAAEAVSEKMAETAFGAVKGKSGKCWYVNFVMRVTPACDCYDFSDTPIVPDIGIFASTDPVALDQACLDAVNEAPGLPGTALKDQTAPGTDKFKAIYPSISSDTQLKHAQEMGLGKRDYELVRLG
jgi:uncharacterized protein